MQNNIIADRFQVDVGALWLPMRSHAEEDCTMSDKSRDPAGRPDAEQPRPDDTPLHDAEQDTENIEEEGEPFPGNFA